jgi:hypothetical protein
VLSHSQRFIGSPHRDKAGDAAHRYDSDGECLRAQTPQIAQKLQLQ